MLIFCFDTETTGLPRDYNAPVSDLSNWPRIVQIGMELTLTDDPEWVVSVEKIIKTDGYLIPKEASDIHGITKEIADRDGYDIKPVLETFMEYAKMADVMVGHNIIYDLNVVGAELLRAGMGNIPFKPIIDTMRESTNYCKLPGKWAGKYKFPKLGELYQILFNEPLAEAHHALADVETTIKCYRELVKREVIVTEKFL
jgi:DNA polymerase III subunit alpha